jgi:hypothetical protein
MSFYVPKYTTLEAVKRALSGKVQFSNSNPKYMSDNDVLDNIEDAEAWIERELSRQYIISPIGIDVDGNDIPFKEIIPRSTIKAIQKLCLVETCIYIMETGFGQSEGVRGQSYIDNYMVRFEKMKHDIVGIDQISGQYLFPPFPGLKPDPQASFYKKGIPFPLASVVGSHPVSQLGRLNQKAIRGQVNPFRNWFFNNMGKHGGNC